jgi:hypothetical protein
MLARIPLLGTPRRSAPDKKGNTMTLEMRAREHEPPDRELYRTRLGELQEGGGQLGWYVRWFFGLAPAATAGDGGAGHGRNPARGRGEGEGK